MNKLYNQFNAETEGEFGYLRFSHAEVNRADRSAVITAVCPSDKLTVARENSSKILSAVKKFIPPVLNVTLEINESYYNKDIILAFVKNFLATDPYISGVVDMENITVRNDNEACTVSIPIPDTALEIAKRSFFPSMLEAFSNTFAFPIKLDYQMQKYTLVTKDEGTRLIIPENVTAFYGKPITEICPYIMDLRPSQTAVCCGTIEGFSKRTSQKNVDYFSFYVKDLSGAVSCLAFPKGESAKLFETDLNGKEVVILGEYKKEADRATFFVRRLSFCSIPENLLEINARAIPEDYVIVKPQPYEDFQQVGLFDVNKPLPSVLEQDIVVFDFETTGRDARTCNIIEIGACKIHKGKITETFTTLVDPLENISSTIEEITHISNDELKGQPIIDDVLPDFYRFTAGCPLVAHNYIFDYSFLMKEAVRLNMCFPTDHFDTMYIARKAIDNLANSKLSTIVEKLGLTNDNAHRGLSDAVATAKVFIKCAEILADKGVELKAK